MFCMSGKGSVITCSVFSPLDLSRGEYSEFSLYRQYYSPNIEEGVNNIFAIGTTSINLPTGSYEIDDILD